MPKPVELTINFSERELDVVINALNYAKGEWATCDDEELTRLSDDADDLEARLEKVQSCLNQ